MSQKSWAAFINAAIYIIEKAWLHFTTRPQLSKMIVYCTRNAVVKRIKYKGMLFLSDLTIIINKYYILYNILFNTSVGLYSTMPL